MDKHIRVRFVPKRSKRRIHSVLRISPWIEPIHSLAKPITHKTNRSKQAVLTSVFSTNSIEQSSKRTFSNSRDQTITKKRMFTNNQFMINVMSIALFVFAVITIIVYLIIRFATKPTNTRIATPFLRWHLTGMMVAGIGGASGLASNQLNAPIDMALDSLNTLYISDCFNNRIQKWKTDAPNGTTIAGQENGTGGMTAAYFRGPKGILIDSNHNIYVSDSTNHRIEFWANGASMGTMIAGTGTHGSGHHELHSPHFISRDVNTNTLYIADFNNDRVMSYGSGASNGTLVIGGHGAGINNTQLHSPVGLYFDSISNNLFISNYQGHHIVRWTLGANSWTLAAGIPGVSGSSSTLLNYPNGITLDPMGNLYVADSANHRIQLFLAGQNVATTIAGMTTFSGSTSVQLNDPYSVRLDSQLNLYVADVLNNRIQKFLRY